MKPLNLFLPLLLLVCTGILHAQSAIVWRLQGPVQYMERPGAAQKSLQPGQSLGLEAVVSVRSGGSVILLYEAERIAIDQAGNYPIKSLVGQREKESSSFMKRFFSYIYDGIVNTSGSKEIEKYHKEYLTQSSGGIKGFAGAEYGLQPTRAILGTFSPGPIHFGWFSTGDSILYDFQILDYQTDGVVFKALLRDTSFVVNIGQLAVEPGRKYYWVVYEKALGGVGLGFNLVDDPSLRSPKMEFVIANTDYDELTRDLEASEEYRNATETERLLMLAQDLEDKQYVFAANKTLQEALDRTPQDPVLRRIYGAFLIRQGLWRTAQAYLPGPSE